VHKLAQTKKRFAVFFGIFANVYFLGAETILKTGVT
jgi:hypothetical protein